MWKTIEFYQRTNIIDLSYRAILRRIFKIYNLKNVVKKKVINGHDSWIINSDYIDDYFCRKKKRKRNEIGFLQLQEKKVHQVKSIHIKPKDIDRYQIELSINFKDYYHQDYYHYIVKDLFLRTGYDLFYIIEKDSLGYNHLHLGIKGNSDVIKLILKHTYSNLYFHEYDADADKIFTKETNVAVIKSHNAYLQYLEKECAIRFLLKDKNKNLFD